MINREAIYLALFNRVKNLAGIVTASRRPRLAKDVAAEEQPALFQEELPETVQYQGPGLPPKYFLHVDLFIWARLAENQAPGSLLNPLVDAVEAALAPDPDEEDQILGGLVQYCRIEGKIDKVNGILDSQAGVFIPVIILAV